MLQQRVLTAAVIAAVLLGVVLWLPAAAVLAVFALVVLAGAWEWSLFPRFIHLAVRIFYVLAVAFVLFGAWHYSLREEGLKTLLYVSFAWWILAFCCVLFAPIRHHRTTAAISGFVVLVPTGIALAHLYLLRDRGSELLLFLLLLVWSADIGAFFAGRKFGRTRLAPHVSPNKTWEGLLGGVIVSAAVAVAGAWWFVQPLLAFMSLCMVVVLVSVVGDLTESMFKRFAGLKDSGSVFPGHGGVLDRFDSITAAAPLFLLGLYWLGWVK